MLQPGTVIELTLPGAEAPIQAEVLSCSSTMLSVRLQEVGTENVHRVSLKKLPYSVVRLPDEAGEQQPAAAKAAANGAQQAPKEQQQAGSVDEEDGSGSEEEEEEEEDAGQPLAAAAGGSGSDDEGGGDEQHDGSGSEGSEGEEPEDEAALDAFPSGTAAAVEAFAAAVEADPGALLAPAPQLAELAKGAAKALYDYAAVAAAPEGSSGGGGAAAAGALPELYIDGFDAEQVWLQLELAAGPALKRARRLLKKAGRAPELLTAEMEEAIDELLEEGPDGSESEQEGGSGEELEGGSGSEGSEGEEEDDGLSDVDYDALLAAGAAQQQRRQAAAAGAEDSEDEEVAAAQLAGSKRKRLSERAVAERAQVEDEHFKLDEMEAFVQQAEREEAGLEGEDEDEEGASGDEEAALEAALERETAALARDKKAAKTARKKARRAAFGEGGEGEMDEEEAEGLGATATYEDFFGPRRGGAPGPAVVAAGGRQRRVAGLGGEEEEEEEGEEEDEEEGFEDDLLDDDMLSGEEEEEEEREGGMGGRRRGGEQGPASDEEGGSEDEEGGWSDEELQAGGLGQRNLLAESESEEEGEGEALSAHELRQQRMADRIRRLEAAALGEKEWFMQGEVDAAERPKNSALEVDLDFETTVKPPPQPTEELTASLDELIKRRIAEARWDDVVRLAAPPPDTKRLEVALDDSKPQQGLGELYEAEYMQAVTGAADDKDEEVRQAARAQFSALCAKLDALSHLHFTPRPVLEEVAVKVDVPAILMEEAAPAFVSGASMRAPEEVYAGEGRRGAAPTADGELEREDRKRRRAQKKRGAKKKRAAKDEERAARAITAGGTAPLVGRKSAAAEEAARKLDKTLKKKSARKGGHSEFGKSSKVFGMIQQHASGETAAAAAAKADAAAPKASHLKL